MSVSRYVTFMVENCLYTVVLSTTVHAIGYYLTALVQFPALVFMLLNSFTAVLTVNTVFIFIVLCNSRGSVTGDFQSNHVAELSKAHASVTTLLYTMVLLCTTSINSPFIAAVPGKTTASSLLALGIVLGFGAIVPFLSILSAFVATPAGFNTSLVNGAIVSAASLLFFLLVSLGSAGTTKCRLSGAANSVAFYMLVFIYWGAIVCIELAIFWEWNPVSTVFGFFKRQPVVPAAAAAQLDATTNIPVKPLAADTVPTRLVIYSRVVAAFKIVSTMFPVTNAWRLVSGVVDFVIVWSTLGFCSTEATGAVEIALLVVVALHVPMVITPDFEVIKKWRHPPINKDTGAIAWETGVVLQNRIPVQHRQGITVASFPPPLTRGAVFGGGYRDHKPFPFTQAAVNNRALATLPRQRRGIFTDSGVFY